MKKQYKILIVSFFIILLAVGIYVVWKQIKNTSVDVVTKTEADVVNGTLPETSEKNVSSSTETTTNTDDKKTEVTNTTDQKRSITLKKLSDVPVFDFWINQKTGDVFYLSFLGKVYLGKDGEDESVSDQQIQALSSVLETTTGEKALVSFGSPQNSQWGVFDSVDKAWRPLPSNILLATWGKDENQLVVIKRNTSTNSLGFLDITKTPPEFKNIISNFSLQDVRLSFVSPSNLFINELPSPQYNSRAWLLDTKSFSLNTLNSGERDLFFRWSQDKSFVFGFGAYSGFQVFNNTPLSNPSPLPFSTIPQKCTGDFNMIYCFVPQEDGVVLFENYIMNKKYSDDVLYIDDASGYLNKVFVSDLNNGSPIDAKTPRISSAGLYFINKFDGFLYRVSGLINAPTNTDPTDYHD